MTGKVTVRDGESIPDALKRLRKEVRRDRGSDKWPAWCRFYAKPSAKRHRKAWIRAMKLKYARIWAKLRMGAMLSRLWVDMDGDPGLVGRESMMVSEPLPNPPVFEDSHAFAPHQDYV